MDFSKLFNLQFMMFAEMAIGYIICRMHILKPSDRSVLSKLVINVLLPASILNAFKMEMTVEVLNSFFQIFIASCGVQLLCTVLAKFAFNKVIPSRKPVMQYATVCSNAGFLGNAVAEGVYGAEGLLFGQIYLIPLRIVMWTAGVSYFASSGRKNNVLKSIITHPCIIACGLGIVRMVLAIPFPAAVDQTLAALGRCATPLIMIFLGMILEEIGFGSMLEKDNLLFALLRLVIIPLIVLGGCMALHLEPLITGLSVVLAAMPAGSTTAVVTEQYNGDVHFAANCVVLTTLLSIALLPVWVIFLNMILGI